MTQRWRVVTPASPIRPEVLAAGLEAARELGFALDVGPAGPPGPLPFLAGEDDARARELADAIPRYDHLYLARGGYGSSRLLGRGSGPIGRAQAARVARGDAATALWAFSDGTSLLGHWFASGWPCWSAPPLSQWPRLDVESRERLVLAKAGVVPAFSALTAVVPGEARGRLFAANLAVLASLAGTPLMPSLEGCVLALEDIHEPAFRVDRFLWQLRESGALAGVRAFVAGDFTGVATSEIDVIGRVFAELAGALGVPCVAGLPFGHGERNACLPLGWTCQVLGTSLSLAPGLPA